MLERYRYSLPAKERGRLRMRQGDLVARSRQDAERQLCVQFGLSALPEDAVLESLTQDALSHPGPAPLVPSGQTKARLLLNALRAHHAWSTGASGGRRAQLSGGDLSGLSLRGVDLSDASLAGADLRFSDLTGSRLQRADLSGADLREAHLGNADLTDCDLSEADLRGAWLVGALLEGCDAYRANLQGAIISPLALHGLLRCREDDGSAQGGFEQQLDDAS